jgi:hypothetical protein
MLPKKGFLAGRKTYVVAVVGLITAVAAWSTGDMLTADMVEAIFAAVAAMTMRAGIAKSGPGNGAGVAKMAALAAVTIGLMSLGGCAKTLNAVDADPIVKSESSKTSAKSESSTGSTAYMDDTVITTSMVQLTPTIMKLDASGAWTSTGGQGGTVTLNIPTGGTVDVTNPETGELHTVALAITAQVWSPKNASVDSVKLNPATGMLEINGVTTNMSEVITAQMPGVLKALEASQGLGVEAAKVKIRELEIKGEITTTAAEAAIAIVEKIPSIIGGI